MRNISVETLKEYEAQGKDYFLIDVREAKELDEVKMEGMPFHHFPMSSFASFLEKIPHDKEVVVFCALGGRSAKMCQVLEEQGFDDVSNLTGGITAWIQE